MSGWGVSRAPRTRWRLRGGACVAVALTALVATFALFAGAAGAAVTHERLFQLGEIPAIGPSGKSVAFPGPLGKMESMTIDSGHLWVAEGSQREPSRVDEFDAETGAFIGQPSHLPTTPTAEELLPSCYGNACGTGIAVGHRFGEAEVYVGGESHGKSVVSIFGETGALKGTWSGASAPGGSFGVGNEYDANTEQYTGPKVGTVTAVAVDNSTSPLDPGAGNVYVAASYRAPTSRAFEEIHVIDVFHPEANGEERYVGQITGPSVSESFQYIRGMAVESNGDLLVDALQYDQHGDVVRSQIGIFEPSVTPGAYTFIGEMSGPPPAGVFGRVEAMTIDSATGDLYVADNGRIEQFSESGAYLGHIDDIPDAFSIAVDSSSGDLYARNVVYGPNIVVPDVTTSAVSGLKSESVTLNGTVNPDGAGPATCEFEWGTTESLGNVVRCSEPVPGGEVSMPVHASLGGLERNQTYYYRLEASNAKGTNLGERWQTMRFATHGMVVREAFVLDVSMTSATFGAKIDPGTTPTNYYFQYGTSTEYEHEVPAAPGEAIGSGTSDVMVPARHVRGLSANSIYHYRVVAVGETAPNEFETVYSPDRTFTTQAAGGSFSLPDGRQWELVSPPSKLGALIESPGYGVTQAAASGDAIAYRANAPTEPEPPGFARKVMVLSTRGRAGWSSFDIAERNVQAAPFSDAAGNEIQIFSEDLSLAAMQPTDSIFTPFSPAASESTAYLRTDFPDGNMEDPCRLDCYRPLVTGKPGFANVPPGTVFGEEPTGECDQKACGPKFEGASPDLSHVVLSSPAQLTATPAPAGAHGLYEWSGGALQLLDVLPEGEEGPAVLAGTGHNNGLGVRQSVSENGQRVIMEGGGEAGGKGLYLRDVAAGETIRLDVPQVGSGPSVDARYMGASGDASRVFFLDSGPLTAESSSSGTDLYEYDVNAPAGSRLTDLSVDHNAGQAADVALLIGSSSDGSYVYFAAGGALAPGASGGECPYSEAIEKQKEKERELQGLPVREQCNLYVRHEGVTRLIAALPPRDSYDWFNELGGEFANGVYARVSPDGRWFAFLSEAELTGYDTHDAVSGKQDVQVYLYEAASGGLVCASCNPSGARPVGNIGGEEDYDRPRLAEDTLGAAAYVPHWTSPVRSAGSYAEHQPRYLSDSGRLFFNSVDALVPQDVNGAEDVYEFEPAGVGSCSSASATFGGHSGGCVSLISAGTSPVDSMFLEASETGGDVFFRTQSRLAPQDYDKAFDVYDAHECTASAPCVASVAQPPACDTEESCKAPPTPQPPLYGAPASATFSGIGNLAPASQPSTRPKGKPNHRTGRKRSRVKCHRKRSGMRRCAKKAASKTRKSAGVVRSRRGGGR